MRYIAGIFLLLLVTSLWGIWFWFEKYENGRPHYHYFHKHPEQDRSHHKHFYKYHRVIKPEKTD